MTSPTPPIQPTQPTQQPTQPFQPPQQSAPPQKHAGAYVGLGLVIVGFVVALTPFVGILGWPLMIAGLVLGIIGTAKKWQPMWANIVNMILGFLGPALALIFVLVGLLAWTNTTINPFPQSTDSAPSVTEEGTTQDSAEAPAPAEAAESDFAVTIDSARLTTDNDGSQVMIVSFTFTNTSDSNQNFMFAYIDKAFQNGVELDSASVSTYDFETLLKDVQPGGTLQLEKGYTLTDQSDVTVEVSELIDFDNKIGATRTFPVS